MNGRILCRSRATYRPSHLSTKTSSRFHSVPLVRDVSERMQVPMDYPAVILVLCLAGAVNRRATIQPKANDTGWVVVPNLWGGIIAAPGFMKSPVIQACTRPLRPNPGRMAVGTRSGHGRLCDEKKRNASCGGRLGVTSSSRAPKLKRQHRNGPKTHRESRS